jgi:XTP/dITP diphosphohydrolase
LKRDPTLVLLATRSAHKAGEIRHILGAHPHIRLLSLTDAGVDPHPDEEGIEAFDTFLENAHAKAAWFHRLTGYPTIADDSGICVHALGGAPGVHSRRYARTPGLDGVALDHANNERLLHELRAVTGSDRSAHYACAAVLHTPHGHRFATLGTCVGLILEEPRGQGGFGYDPLFLLPSTGLSFGEMTAERKHRFSHRARAFRPLADLLEAAADMPTDHADGIRSDRASHP